MPRWDYKKIDLNDLPRRSTDIDILNDAGRDGWELAAITENAIAFMRRVIATEPGARKGKTTKG